VIGFDTKEKRTFDTNETNYLLSNVETEDLIHFGLIPEFIGRFNSIANFNELTLDDLVSILTEPKNAIIKQYQALFHEDHVDLDFTKDALLAIAAKAKEAGTGARALRMIVENLLIDLMYDTPSDPTIKKIVIDEACVKGNGAPKVTHDEEAV